MTHRLWGAIKDDAALVVTCFQAEWFAHNFAFAQKIIQPIKRLNIMFPDIDWDEAKFCSLQPAFSIEKWWVITWRCNSWVVWFRCCSTCCMENQVIWKHLFFNWLIWYYLLRVVKSPGGRGRGIVPNTWVVIDSHSITEVNIFSWVADSMFDDAQLNLAFHQLHVFL